MVFSCIAALGSARCLQDLDYGDTALSGMAEGDRIMALRATHTKPTERIKKKSYLFVFK
jgi:hypothetical protein